MIKPNGNRVLVKLEALPEKTKSGIQLPYNNRHLTQEKVFTGKVVALGDGELSRLGINITPSVKVGDRVMFSKYDGNEPKSGEIFLKDEQIMAVIDR